jgi:hypothetical protein
MRGPVSKSRGLARATCHGFVLATLLALLSQGVDAQASATRSDSLLLAIGAMAQDGAASTRDVWPAFSVPSQFVACRSGGRTIMVGSADVRSRLEGSPGSVTRDGMLLLATPPGRLASVCFDLDFRVGDSRLIAVPVVGPMYSVGDSLTATVVTLYHEAFHAFQGQRFSPTRTGQYTAHQEIRIPLGLVRSTAFDSLARAERLLLAEALRLRQSDSIRAVVSRYLDVRASRMQLLPPALRQAEAHNERKEGSAQWVGYTAALIRMGRSREDVRALIARDLRETPSFTAGDAKDYFGNAYRKWHVYATGAALAELLDRAGVAWREEIQAGASFEELARQLSALDQRGVPR